MTQQTEDLRDIEIRNAQGERLDTTVTLGAPERHEIVVIAHGVTSHKDRPWLIALSDALAARGIASVRFSFSGNGDSEGRFEDSTITKQVEDLGYVLDAFDGWKIAYAGHSMGGAVGTIRAAIDPRIQAFVSLAGMVHVSRFIDRMFSNLRPGIDVMLDKPECPYTENFLDDARHVGDVLEAGKRILVPWLIVHGTADDIVPFRDAVDICEATRGKPELARLNGVDHKFTDHYDDMTDAVVPWLEQRLAEL